MIKNDIEKEVHKELISKPWAKQSLAEKVHQSVKTVHQWIHALPLNLRYKTIYAVGGE